MNNSTAYLFPGQGSQYAGMGRNLSANYPEAYAIFDQSDRLLDMPLSQLCCEDPADSLNDTQNTQPAILATSIAALRAIEARELIDQPSYVAGHSMGEFSALVAADALSFEDGLKLVRVRGQLMAQAGDQNPGGMAAILGLERETLEAICAMVRKETGEYVGIANDNCPGQIVISGANTALKQAMTEAQAQGAKRAIRLAVSIAAHSPLMAEVADDFRRHLDSIPFRKPIVPIVANATAGPLTDPDDIRKALGQQLTSAVRWTESMRWMIDQGVTRFIEIGPKDVLTRLLRRIDRKVKRSSTADILAM